MIRLATYFSVWKLLAANELQRAFINRYTNLIFFSGKAIRLGISLAFLLLLRSSISQFSDYTSDQILIFFLTYHFIDLVTQTLYRGVYTFSYKIRSGEFDFDLAKPINPLFQALVGKPDANDALFFIPSLLVALAIGLQLDITITTVSLLWYLVLFCNGLLLATSLNIVVLTIGVLTTEVDGIIWMYRDISKLGQFPVSIYMEPVRLVLFFVVPIGTMISVPAEALLGVPSTTGYTLALALGAGSLIVSTSLWKWALKRYASASS